MKNLIRPRIRQQKHGFTLIELLVVISIIALLVAILLPALQSARSVALAAKCLSNQRQILIGVVMYAHDYDQGFPAPVNSPRWGTVNGGGASYWGHALFKPPAYNSNNYPYYPADYLQDRLTFLCPEMRQGIEDVSKHAPSGHHFNSLVKSYGMFDVNVFGAIERDNGMLKETPSFNPDSPSNTFTWRHYKLDFMPQPSNYGLFACVTRGDSVGAANASWNNRFPATTNQAQPHAWMIHKGSVNIGNGDGHVSAYKPEDMRSLENNLFTKGSRAGEQGIAWYRDQYGIGHDSP